MTRTNKIKVVVASDQPVVLSGLQNWFDTHERYRVSVCAPNAELLLSRLEHAAGELIVMACTIDSSSEAWPVMREARRRSPDAPIVVLTLQTDAHQLRAIHTAGAAGIVSKHDDVRELERVCSRVLSGMTQVMSKSVAALCDAARSFDGAAYRGVRLTVKAFNAPS
ncbi:response regulator [Caballeronia sp. BR00000012568055]|uniref:response regulator n=1 Tax=Caballeronia sp. BR00000012568055 TaxID=2918761 RepID=UPI0023F8063F|nr:response regulator [Caballeronia sp. BR00000012568055]